MNDNDDETNLSGMALSIRSCVESTTFDLGGQSTATIQHTIQAAFAQPFRFGNNNQQQPQPTSTQMIRLTFVTGAGKQARQKYDPSAARTVTSTLQALDYCEDRTASCVLECAGTFKLQHDTGKNLKTVLVFPKVVAIDATKSHNDNAPDEQQSTSSSSALVPKGCPAHKIAVSSPATFERMMRTQCPTWSQKKGCLVALEHLQSMVQDLDDQLLQGQVFSKAEQDFYNDVTALDEKCIMVRKALQQHVETGDLTYDERDLLLQQNTQRRTALVQEWEAKQQQQQQQHESTSKNTTTTINEEDEQYQAALDKVAQRRAHLQQITPHSPPPLKHHVALAKLWKQVAPLLQSEHNAKGRLRTVSETQALARKEALLEEIEQLENASRGWFEDEIAFQARLDEIRHKFTSQGGARKGGTTSSQSSSSGTSSSSTGLNSTSYNAMKQQKWVIPGERGQKKGGRVKKKKTDHSAGGVFTAMMAEDSSDDDDHDDHSEVQQTNDTQESRPPMATTASSTKSKKSSKKKKKNKSRAAKVPTDDEAVLDAAVAANRTKHKTTEAVGAHPAIVIFQTYLLPPLRSLWTWMATMLTSSPSSETSSTFVSKQFVCSCLFVLVSAAILGKAAALPMDNTWNHQGHLRTSATSRMIDRFLADETPCTAECCAEFYACPKEEEDNPFTNTPLAFQIILIVLLILFSAFFSGLTLGLMGLDKTGLEIVMEGDDPINAEYAKKIYPIRKRGNLLLCTLLLGNVCVNSLLSILTADKFGGAIGLVSSTMLIVIFGEIVPQALCQRHSLYIGSRSVPVVRVVMIFLMPVSYPLSVALDYWLGEELATTYSTAELGKLLQIHVQENVMDPDTATAMRGALGYKDKIVQDVMTPLENTFMLSADEQLNFETIARIFKTGYSRIPVYSINKNNVIGLLFVKDLIFIDPEDNTLVSSFVDIFGRGLHVVWPDDSLGDVLRELKSGKSHMALVRDVNNSEGTDPYYEIRGIITLEDIIEEIIGDEIVDETDAFVDGTHSVRVDRAEEFQWAALRLLDSKIVDERLSYEETKAVTAHLSRNFSNIFSLVSEAQLHRLVLETPVSVLAKAEQEVGKDLPDDLLYERGVGTETCTLILSGKLTVVAGQDNFRSDVSSWSLLAGNALTNSQYQPDFTAFVSEACRCLRITRTRFAAASEATLIERQDASHGGNGLAAGNIPTPAPPPVPEGAPSINVPPPMMKDMAKADGKNRKVKFLNALQAVTSDETTNTNPRAAKMASVRRMDSSKSLGEDSTTGKEQQSSAKTNGGGEQETTLTDTPANADSPPKSGGDEEETTIVFDSSS